jgi:hypothetical protein
MRQFGVVCCVLLVGFSAAAACSGDEKAKHVISAAGSAGAGLGGDGISQGAGTGQPAGAGGALVEPAGGAGGAAPVATAGAGMSAGGAEPMTPAGGAGGAGGAPAIDCPAEMGNFTHNCGEVAALWSPVWNDTLHRFELDVSSLPFPIASGTVSYFYDAEASSCGTVAVQVSGDIVSASPEDQAPALGVRISTFSLVDVCGNHHDYDPIGNVCSELKGSGNASVWPLVCNVRAGACPEVCMASLRLKPR